MKAISALALIFMLLAAPCAFADERALKREAEEMRTEKRYALVIGNGNYDASPLKNPVNDARLISGALKDVGFEVQLLENASKESMERAIDEFGVRIRRGGVALFYYAGHGMQVKGDNYLIPVGGKIESEGDVKYKSVNLGLILSHLEAANTRVNIVMLDACRDNPFARSSRSGSRGLASVEETRGTYISYATAPGSTAADGTGVNSLYTEAFARILAKGAMPIEKVFKTVRTEVREASGGRQIPWDHSSLEGEFFFNLPGGSERPGQVASLGDSTSAPAIAPKRPDGQVKAPEDMVYIEGGCFNMGDATGEGESDEAPLHEACLSDFYIGKYEVTQALWRDLMGVNPAYYNRCGDNCPVENISWLDIQDFLAKLNAHASNDEGGSYRLPTEAEWEYAARGGAKGERFAGSSSADPVAWHNINSGGRTHPVGEKRPNSIGLYDMNGNVWEWCSDVYSGSYYGRSPRTNPLGPETGNSRVTRGGSCTVQPKLARTAVRYSRNPQSRDNTTGFRLVWTP